VGLPLIALWCVAFFTPGAHQPYLDEFDALVWLFVKWVGLGVLSSIGLGTGMHSGILFLFPHVVQVVMAASECNSLRFDTYGPNSFICPTTVDKNDSITFLGLFLKVFWPCFLWGGGTAIGEIPPYALSRAARLAGKKNEEIDDLVNSDKHDLVTLMKEWMFKYLQKHGFWAVLAFASWPNAMFDLCGMACGHFLIPFSTFFGATFIGKALIKVNLQAAFFILIFRDEYLQMLVNLISWVSGSYHLEEPFKNFIANQKAKFRQGPQDVPPSALQVAFQYFVIFCVLWFAKSIVDSFAQQRQAELDGKEIEKMRRSHKKGK